MSQPVDLRPDHAKIVHDILSEHLPAGVSVRVFGSRAKWAAKPHSDLDLALKGKGPLPPSLMSELAEAFSESDLPFKVDVVDWHSVASSFQAVIDRDGAPLPPAREKLGEIATIQQGKYLPKNAMADARSEERPIPVHGANGIIGWTTRPMYQHGVPLVTCRGSNSGMVLWAEGPLWVSNNAMAVLPHNGCNRFMYYRLLSEPPYDTVSGSAQPQITRQALAPREYVVPDDQAQIAIERLLSAVDDKIELNQRMNETLETQARALFRDWFVDFGPVKAKMAGDTPYLAPEVWSHFPERIDDADVPEGWNPATLNDFVSCQNRKADPGDVDEETPYIGLEHMPRRSIALSEWEGAKKVTSTKSRFRRREILFGKLRPYFHKVGIAPVAGICSTDIVVMAPKKERFEALALACVSTDEFVAFADQSSSGTKMPRTNWKIMKAYPMVMPDNRTADAFQAICGPMLDRILANIEESHCLSETRDLLLPKLMSGEIRVVENTETESVIR